MGALGYYRAQQRARNPVLLKADWTTASVGGLSASSFLATYLMTIARSTAGRVQTGTSAISASIAANFARFGKRLDADTVGLILDAAALCANPSSRLQNTTNGWTVGLATYGTSTGVDGTSNGCARHTASGTQYGTFYSYTGFTASAPYTNAWWQKPISGATYQTTTNLTSSRAVKSGSVFAASTWEVVAHTFLASGSSYNWAPLDCRDWSPLGGTVATARTFDVDFACIFPGRIAYEPVDTTTAAATVGADQLSYASGNALIDAGRIGLGHRVRPKGASSDYATNLPLWTIDANNYAEIDASTRAVRIVIGGTAYVTASTMTWGAHDDVRVWTEAGGTALQSVAKYQVNSGSVVTLGTSGSPQGNVAAAGAIDLNCSGTAKTFTGRHLELEARRAGSRLAWAA